MNKVSWPSRTELIRSALVVIFMMFFLALVVGCESRVTAPNELEMGEQGVAALFFDLPAHVGHVQVAGLFDQLLERGLGQGSGLAEDNDLIAEDHQGGDGADLKVSRDFLLLLGIDLGKHDLRVLTGDFLVSRGERAAGPAPGRPEVYDHETVSGDGLFEIFLGQFDYGHR